MTLFLKPITKENWRQAIRLEVTADQRLFVASNLYSIAESRFEPHPTPMGIYAGEEMVGFLMVGELGGEIWIWRLMVDQRYQRQGYGRAATQMLIGSLRARGHQEVFVSYDPENSVAVALYAGLGFQDTGRVEDGEIVVRLVLEAG